MFAMSYLAVSAIQAAGIVPITLPPPQDCVERLREAIALVKGLWSEGPFTFSGMHYTITEMDGWPKPCHPWRDGLCRQGHYPRVAHRR
jgi:alkanesulfonate monooxygenase SsuD/methylene tetrahydromethanopterin reductase-like flavin-dependent oxidoreductase (luciferase family)